MPFFFFFLSFLEVDRERAASENSTGVIIASVSAGTPDCMTLSFCVKIGISSTALLAATLGAGTSYGAEAATDDDSACVGATASRLMRASASFLAATDSVVKSAGR